MACRAARGGRAEHGDGLVTVGGPVSQGVRLAKYEGAGNDFLVHIDLDDRRRLAAEEVSRLCDRRRGVGADGVLRVLASPDADVAMELRNADGSPAEMSGNGIRCLAHAVLDAGVVRGPVVDVATAAGRRLVTVRPGARPGEVEADVTMGTPRLDAEGPVEELLAGGLAVSARPPATPGPVGRARQVDVGNPHLVVAVTDPAVRLADLLGWAAAVDGVVPGGCNVELVRVGADGAIELVVWERGAGATLACGTGSCAAAVACEAWGLVELPVTVANPGGRLRVGRHGDAVWLAGPSRRVADIWVDAAWLDGGGGAAP